MIDTKPQLWTYRKGDVISVKVRVKHDPHPIDTPECRDEFGKDGISFQLASNEYSTGFRIYPGDVDRLVARHFTIGQWVNRGVRHGQVTNVVPGGEWLVVFPENCGSPEIWEAMGCTISEKENTDEQ